jgi:hypothetical protein
METALLSREGIVGSTIGMRALKGVHRECELYCCTYSVADAGTARCRYNRCPTACCLPWMMLSGPLLLLLLQAPCGETRARGALGCNRVPHIDDAQAANPHAVMHRASLTNGYQ